MGNVDELKSERFIKEMGSLGIKFVDRETASKIIETRTPEGKFITINDGFIIAIDNENGEAWTEEYKTKNAALCWLSGTIPANTAYKLDKISEKENEEGLTVSRLVYMLRQINGFWEVKKENGMPVEKITIEVDNEGKPYVKIC